jgi:hypothetical protein
MPRRPARVALLVGFLLLFFAAPSAVRFYTDWLWFGELRYQHVFATILRAQGTLFTIAFVATLAWLVVNLRLATGSVGDLRPVFTTRDGIEVVLPGRQQLRTIARVVAAVIAVFVGLYAAARWDLWLSWRNAVAFGRVDPLLGYDVGYFVFSLPFLRFVRAAAQALVVLAALAAGGLYLAGGSLTSGFPARFSMAPTARKHLGVLAGLFFVLMAAGAWLRRPAYLVEASGLLYGASYADVYGRLPATLALVVVCLLGAGLALRHAFGRSNWPIPVAIGLYVLVALGGELYSTLLQRFVVTPNEQARETAFITHNIEATRRAFGLDGIEERQVSGDALLTRDDIAANRATLDNVRLWDHQPLLETFGQLQEIRTYYDFVSVDNDRYRLDGVLRQVMLSARELNSTSLLSRTWPNERLTFTHGYGLTLGPVNEVTPEGLPVLFVRDLPPQTSPGLRVDEPSLYFGERSNDYVIVRSNQPEFHYPRGDDNVSTRYDGRGGVPVGTLWRKLLFAMRFASYEILVSDQIGPDSRILFNRNIRERLRRLMPFVTLDQDPYLVLADGRLYWMADAYTTSSMYPYSTPVGAGVNYIRNSVKFVVDAYHGTTDAYLADPGDPIAATYARVFPNTFKPLAEMPQAIREHVRYPEDIFAVQAQVYATFHMTQPAVFYNKEDQWDVPTIDEGSGDAVAMQPYYTIMRLPGEADAEFIQMLPFTPRRRDNLAAWLVARSDGEHYGRLRVFEFPKQTLVYGPRQVVARIAQDQVISPQITLWNQQGSAVIWGTLMVIPIEESLIYVRPLYLRASGGRIPELTRVIVAYGNRIVMEATLDAAIARLFGEGVRGGPAKVAPVEAPATAAASSAPRAASAAAAVDLADLAAQARAHYERAVAAQKAGDWATYGDELRQLGQVLDRMRAR